MKPHIKRILNKLEEGNAIVTTQLAKLHAAQDKCAHPDPIVSHHADTGNYDPTADRYWDEFSCPDCTKKWTTEIKR